MKKIVVLLLLILLLILNGCSIINSSYNCTEETSAASEIYTQPTSMIEKTLDKMVEDGAYMLCESFGFYQGTKDMSEIRSITFSNIAPDNYDERWNANLADTDDIQGYLIGENVIIVGDYIYTSEICSYMFAAENGYGDRLWSNLIEVNGLELLNTSYAEDMTMMFAFSKLTKLNGIEKWDVSNVKKFAGMFQGHSNSGDVKFEYLDIKNWDTSSAENMSHMFYGCAAMKYIPVENWDVSKVETFSHMFADCYGMENIDFSKWKTLSAKSFDGFLNDCHSLVVVDVTGLDTSNCEQFSQMFEACINLEHIIGLNTWDVSSASYYAFSETFHCCYKLQEIDISNWCATPDNTARMFKNCYNITQVDMSNFNMSNIQVVTEMFMNTWCLTEIAGMESWDLTNVRGYETIRWG